MELDQLIKTKQFLEEITSSVHSIISKKFPHLNGGDSEDIEQEVKLKIWKMVSNGKKIDNLKSYLWKVVYTTALDIMETQLKELPLETYLESMTSVSPLFGELGKTESGIEKEELKKILEKIIDSLPPKRRTVLKLHLAGMDLDEMADFLNWTHHKVRHLFYRGVQDLKVKLKAGQQPSGTFIKEGTNEKLAKNVLS